MDMALYKWHPTVLSTLASNFVENDCLLETIWWHPTVFTILAMFYKKNNSII